VVALKNKMQTPQHKSHFLQLVAYFWLHVPFVRCCARQEKTEFDLARFVVSFAKEYCVIRGVQGLR
jgi:hypothetical protein